MATDWLKSQGLVTYKAATSVVVGDRVVERDGAFFEVSSVTREGRNLVFGLKNVNGYMTAPSQVKVAANRQVRVATS